MKNRTMMQYFEWYLPNNGLHWKRCAAQAKELKDAGINMVWLPPAYKGAAGKTSVGYDVYDMYDLGEFDQKGTVATKYGTREDFLKAVQVLQTVTRETYKAYLNDNEKIFVLNEGVYDSRILYMGEVTSDGKFTLTWYTEEEMISVELIAEN